MAGDLHLLGSIKIWTSDLVVQSPLELVNCVFGPPVHPMLEKGVNDISTKVCLAWRLGSDVATVTLVEKTHA